MQIWRHELQKPARKRKQGAVAPCPLQPQFSLLAAAQHPQAAFEVHAAACVGCESGSGCQQKAEAGDDFLHDVFL